MRRKHSAILAAVGTRNKGPQVVVVVEKIFFIKKNHIRQNGTAEERI